MPVVHAAEAIAGRHQQVSTLILADRKHFIAGHPIGGGVSARPAIAEQHQAAVVKANPDAAATVLVDGSGLVAGQTLGLRIDGEHVIAKAVQPAVHPDPQIALAVFINAADPVKIPAAFAGGREETSLLKPRQPAIGAGPQVAVAILPERAHEGVGQPVARGVLAELTFGREHEQALGSGHPEVGVAVFPEAQDDVFFEGCAADCLNKLPARQAGDASVTRDPERVRTVFANSSHGCHGQVLARFESGELAGLVAAQVDAGDDPKRARVVFEHVGDAVVGKAVALGVGVELVVLIARQAVRSADPERAIAARGEGRNRVAGKLAVVFAEDRELIAVEARQTLIGAQPKIAVGGLRNGANRVLRQALLLGPDSARVLRQSLLRVQRVQGRRSEQTQAEGCEEARKEVPGQGFHYTFSISWRLPPKQQFQALRRCVCLGAGSPQRARWRSPSAAT